MSTWRVTGWRRKGTGRNRINVMDCITSDGIEFGCLSDTESEQAEFDVLTEETAQGFHDAGVRLGPDQCHIYDFRVMPPARERDMYPMPSWIAVGYLGAEVERLEDLLT